MTPTEPKIILYVHPATISYYDYRELLERSTGVMFSATGDSWDAYGFEADITPAEFIQRVSTKYCGKYDTRIAIGTAIERRSNLNPHGLI
jgi:hypothetical protein